MATLNLNIHKVVCVDEIGGEWEEKFGNDEIYLGGVTISSSNIGKVDPFEIYADFDDGEVQEYNPPRVFTHLIYQTMQRGQSMLALYLY
ncbi:MAG: hypothetical protein HZT40_01250 [Candidatus Thiothrix singaporensis]|uniref:Uncharacterized protein n=1 Tax=Candidatus Thiothrix singaporensis TaxID=2799669 RepID=A0A7L6AMX8_9GAMM|nr:MAG: hypothetical protein HZT40_01250 [Candidatus Thiothrix singaporensis]